MPRLFLLLFPLFNSPRFCHFPAMNSRLQNQLNMVGACISVAESSDYKSVWDGQPPADFGADIAQLAATTAL